MSQNSSNNDFSEAISLSRLSQQIRNSLSGSFPVLFRVIAEISEFTVNKSGHAYLELIEKDSGSHKILARIRATIWSFSYRMIRPYFEGSTGYALGAGIKVLVEVSIDYHPQYGLSLNIRDIDPSYTLGDLARKKAEIIRQLKEEGVYTMNQSLSLPLVPQRIAVISSETAAGYGDFLNSLNNNEYGFHFFIHFFPAIMQGEKSEESVIRAMEAIYSSEENYDVLVIIRGGGAKIDLECFNNYDLAYHIGQFPLPVITGIGHERDETVADLVANTRMKTPTAVAGFLINKMVDFLTRMEQNEHQLKNTLLHRISNEQNLLRNYSMELASCAKEELRKHEKAVDLKIIRVHQLTGRHFSANLGFLGNAVNRLSITTNTYIRRKQERIGIVTYDLQKNLRITFREKFEKINHLAVLKDNLDPVHVLKRGFSVTLKNGKTLMNSADIKKDDIIETLLYQGKLTSKITERENGKKKSGL